MQIIKPLILSIALCLSMPATASRQAEEQINLLSLHTWAFVCQNYGYKLTFDQAAATVEEKLMRSMISYNKLDITKANTLNGKAISRVLQTSTEKQIKDRCIKVFAEIEGL